MTINISRADLISVYFSESVKDDFNNMNDNFINDYIALKVDNSKTILFLAMISIL